MPVITPTGGGGSSPTRVLGPFPFAFNTAGIDVDGAVLTALASGTVVVRTLLRVTAIWDGAGIAADRFLSVGVAPASAPTAWNLLGITQASRIASSTSPTSGLVASGEILNSEATIVCGEAAVATIFSEPAGMTQGTGELYLVVTS